jgi:hypothetical protein
LEQRKRFGIALYKTLQNPEIEIACLLTSVNQQYQRISMHGVRSGIIATTGRKHWITT